MNKFNFNNLNVNTTQKLDKFRKEKGFYKAVVLTGLHDNEIKSFAEIRLYRTASTNYACFWIHSPVLGLYGQTGGKAGGYGYDREEAAINNAALEHGISGEWCNGRNLLEALANHLGLKVYTVIETYA